jgi:outer membrane protein assembly factor BamB
MHKAILTDLEAAQSFILVEFFIIEQGKFWDSILSVLERKASEGLTVRVCYDDIGCMSTLPGNYAAHLRKKGISAIPFSRLRGKNPVTIRRLDALTGEEIWTYEIDCVYNADQLSGVKASPVMGENEISDLVIFTVNMTGGKNNATIVALEKATGREVWRYELDSTAVSSPVAVYNKAGKAWIVQADQKGRLYLLDGKTGDVRNMLDLGGEIQASPAVYKDMLLIGTCSKDNAYMYGIRLY